MQITVSIICHRPWWCHDVTGPLWGDSPHKWPVTLALMFSFMLALTHCWTNSWVFRDFKCHDAHVRLMYCIDITAVAFSTTFEGVVQEAHNSIANPLELRLSCTNLSISTVTLSMWHDSLLSLKAPGAITAAINTSSHDNTVGMITFPFQWLPLTSLYTIPVHCLCLSHTSCLRVAVFMSHLCVIPTICVFYSDRIHWWHVSCRLYFREQKYICIYYDFSILRWHRLFEFFPHRRLKPIYLIWAIPWLLITSPGHQQPGPWFNIKMSSYQYRKSHCGDKTVVRSSYLHNGISFTGKMSSLYWIGALGIDLVLPDCSGFSTRRTNNHVTVSCHERPLMPLVMMIILVW